MPTSYKKRVFFEEEKRTSASVQIHKKAKCVCGKPGMRHLLVVKKDTMFCSPRQLACTKARK